MLPNLISFIIQNIACALKCLGDSICHEVWDVLFNEDIRDFYVSVSF